MRIENLKRQTIALFLLIFSLIFLSGIARAKEKLSFIQRFSIKMSSGSGYFKTGDINVHLESGNEMHSDYAQYFNGLKKGDLKKIEFGSDSGIELRFDVSSWFGIYFTSGYFYTRRESSSGFEISLPEFFLPEFFNVDLTFSPRISIRTIPLESGASLFLPFGQKAKIFLNVGIGYYFAKVNYYWEEREIWTRKDGSLFTDITEMAEWNLSSRGSGYHGRIGFEYTIGKNLALVFEVQGRSARLKKLEGTEIFLGTGYSESFYGSVYYYEKKNPVTEKYYIGLGFFKERPDFPSPDYRNIRDAELDLSGYSFKIGIRIRLF